MSLLPKHFSLPTTTKMKPRQSEIPQIKCHKQRYPLRPTYGHNITRNNSTCHEPKRVSNGGNSPRNGRHHANHRVYTPPPRCSRVGPPLLPSMFSYNNYGRSTAPHNDVISRDDAPGLNPYTELAKEVSLAIHMQEKTLPPAETSAPETKTLPPESDSGRGPHKIDMLIKEKPPIRNVMADTEAENILGGRGFRDDDDEEDAEEGMTQVNSNEYQNLTTTQMEMLKVLHQAKMEMVIDHARPKNLLYHLQDAGYFNYNYSRHARTTADNLNLKQGLKKPIERLLTLLSIH